MKYSTCAALVVLCLFGTAANAQSFNSSGLRGESLTNPTSLDFGPDDRLYVSQQDGKIFAFTVSPDGDSYRATSTEEIALLQAVLNHNDTDGEIFNGLVERQITGILAAGTAAAPVLYVTSSDYRIGGGGGGSDLNLDTNSGIVHKLTRNPDGTWTRVDLVRGLPRSEENHAPNGMQLSGDGETLYLAQGGNTNAGAPSNNFAFITEYALSAAVLTIDLAAVEALPTLTWHEDGSQYKYDLPTLDDPTRPNTGPGGGDEGDPFGGNDGLNQAKLVEGGPVQVYATGFRNLYDLVLTADGRLYGWDNGANGGWGGHPANEGIGTATNEWIPGEPGSRSDGPNDAAVNNEDGLHFITGEGYYAGHPNPVRANPTGAGLFTQDGGGGGAAGVWRTATTGPHPLPADWPPVPASLANPIEGDFQNAGVDDRSLWTITSSTNGMCEYTSAANGGQLQGDLLAASFNGKIYRVKRNAAGSIDSDDDVTVLAENFGSSPLDVTSRPDGVPFAGTIWAVTYGANNVTVFTPADTSTGGGECTAADDPTLDTDLDGFTNADEYENGSDPCSQASTPPDADGTRINGFKVSDLNDPDDDDDGIPDHLDRFALDPDDGLATELPLDLPLLNGDPGTGFFGVGFTGLMTNGEDYLDNLADETNSATEIIAGGAVGLFTINGQGSGDPYVHFNSLKNGFQLGFPLSDTSSVTTLETKLLGPIWSSAPQSFQQAGFALSDGTQESYLKVVPIAKSGTMVEVQYQEDDRNVYSADYEVPGLAEASEIRLLLTIDPPAGTVQPKIALGDADPENLGSPIHLTGDLLEVVQGPLAPALTLIVTSGRGGLTMDATYDYVRVGGLDTVPNPPDTVPNPPDTVPDPPEPIGRWSTIDGQSACQAMGQPGSCAQGRHEASYVQVGDKFYLLGGREHGSNVNVYDPATDTWSVGAAPDFPVHHFQAVAYDGLIYAVGTFGDNDFPHEVPYDKVVIYDPARDRWFDGPTIPADRARGSAGCVVVGGGLYLLGGITDGHSSGWSTQVDRFDPVTATWTSLAEMPRARDHFHAAVAGGKIYVAGGRRSGEDGTFAATVSEVDVYDVADDDWTTLPYDLPTERAGAAVGVLDGELLVIGGEREAGPALSAVEALDLEAQTWRALTSLTEGRHGTGAIVNNGAVYVASGSPNRGGGSTRTQERFTFLDEAPAVTGEPLVGAHVELAASVQWDFVPVGSAGERELAILHGGGNQGLVIEEVSVSGDGFTVVGGTAALAGRLIRPGGEQTIVIEYAPGSSPGAEGTLSIRTSADDEPRLVALLPGEEPSALPDGFVAEAGVVTIPQSDADQWTRVDLEQAYTDPIVIAHIASFNGGQPVHPRVRAIGAASFEVQLEEWAYLDGYHNAEEVSYIVVEAGTYDFGGGVAWTAGRRTVGTDWTDVQGEPVGEFVAVASLNSENDPQPCIIRQRRTGAGLQLKLREEEAAANDLTGEEVHYLLVSAGGGYLDDAIWESIYGEDVLTHTPASVDYAGGFATTPVLFADLQTHDGGDPSHARTKQPGLTGFVALAEEEKSRDTEVWHTTERLGYFALEPGVWGAPTVARRPLEPFRAAAVGREVELSWGIDDADRRDRSYGVERLEASGAWAAVASGIPPLRDGSHEDVPPTSGVNRYRLRTDFPDGTYTLGGTRTVRIDRGLPGLAAYPNPSADYFDLTLPGEPGRDVDVRIVNALGSVVRQVSLPGGHAGVLRVEHDWPSGTYHVRVTIGGASEVLAIQVP